MARCACGQVELALKARPFLSAVCYCDDCQAAGRTIGRLEGTHTPLEADRGTAYVLVRKDRVSVQRGADRLAEFRLAPSSPTRRVIATCCNTPMFLDVAPAHWVTVYRDRLAPEDRPAIEMRVMTRHRASALPYPDAASRHAGHTGRFFLKVLGAWISMGFRRPRLAPYPHISL
ncbi:GFA family protein [Pelagibacterium montanilacus]|uniref:GFA family protein n=1 Tax=Pelagibacterium montanilacus TaxID=2185280 RepID=UPI000F8F4B2B|nr:DUF6151 family protein [Pelagibacterium montanilacus]